MNFAPYIAIYRRFFWPIRTQILRYIINLAIGVATLLSIGSLLESAEVHLKDRASDLLGADLRINSWRHFDKKLTIQLENLLRPQGKMTKITEFATMAKVDGDPFPFLISALSVQGKYPLKGQLLYETTEDKILPAGTHVLVAKSIAIQRNIQVGDSITIGGINLVVGGLIIEESSAGISGVLSFAPRVIIDQKIVHRMGLLEKGSRSKHSILFALSLDTQNPINVLEKLTTQVQSVLPSHIELQLAQTAQPNTLVIFERLAIFFMIIGLVTLVLSILSVSMSHFTLMQNLLPSMTQLRSLGVSTSMLERSYLAVSLGAGLIASGIGVIFGTLIQYGLILLNSDWLGSTVHTHQPWQIYYSWSHIWMTILLGVSVSVCLAWVTSKAQSRVVPQKMMGQDSPEIPYKILDYLVLIVSMTVLVMLYLWQLSGNWYLTCVFFVGLVVLICLAMFIIYLTILCGRYLNQSLQKNALPGLSFAIRNLLKSRQYLTMMTLGLTIGFSCLLSLRQVQQGLAEAVQEKNEYIPRVFLLDIQKDQRQVVQSIFQQEKIHQLELIPIIRARLAALNNVKVSDLLSTLSSNSSRSMYRTYNREYSVTTSSDVRSEDILVEGRWWTDQESKDPTHVSVSLEERLANRLGVGVGDTMTLDIQGREIRTEVMSIRRVNWLNFKPNFLIIATEGALKAAPKTWIAGGGLQDESQLKTLSQSLFKVAPNITLVDLRPIFKVGRQLLNTIANSFTLVGSMCLLCGALLLIASILQSRGRYVKIQRLLHDLGVHHRKARRWIRLELIILGIGIAGVVLLLSVGLSLSILMSLKLPLTLGWSELLSFSGIICLLPPILGLK